MVTMNTLPVELLVRIFRLVPIESQALASFTCRKWLRLYIKSLPPLARLKVTLDDEACSLSIESERYGSSDLGHGQVGIDIRVCQCTKHVQTHETLLAMWLQQVGILIKHFVLDDCSVARNFYRITFVDSLVGSLSSSALQSIEFHDATLTQHTLRQLTRFRSLQSVSIVQSVVANNDRRLCDPFFSTLSKRIGVSLTQIDLSFNSCITDRTLCYIAAYCTTLFQAKFDGCCGITARGVFYFLLHLDRRMPDLFQLQISDCSGISMDELNYFVDQEIELKRVITGQPGDIACFAVQSLPINKQAVCFKKVISESVSKVVVCFV